MKISKAKGLLFIVCIILLTGFFLNTKSETHNVLFSWKKSAIIEKSQILFETAKEQNINVIYQYFNSELSDEQISAFIQEANTYNIEVYLLDGKPSWGTEQDGDSMKKVIERVAVYNQENPEAAIKGVILDTEPYVLKNWEEEQDSIMEYYLSGVKETYSLAKKEGIEFALCISCFYDTWGHEQVLEQLIQNCDTVVVMNYQRGSELSTIKLEVSYAKKYKKPIVTVYELQPAGEHGITERNTYYNIGLQGLYENFKELRNQISDVKLFYGLHEFEALQEVISHE